MIQQSEILGEDYLKTCIRICNAKNLYRPGLARVALSTDDINADYSFLIEKGIEVLSKPVTVKMSDSSYSQFFCFKDPDGTFLELVQVFSNQR